jgi:hypothetical protein
MGVINLTPHTINIVGADGTVAKVYPPSGQQARVSSRAEVVGAVDGVPIVRTVFGELSGLPEPQEGTLFIVSSVVAQAVAGRDDVVAPDTGPESVVRDAEGKIIGVRRFQKF